MIKMFAFGSKRSLPMVFQSESSECALACLAMLAGYYGYSIDLYSLRKKIDVTLNGLTLAGLNSSAIDIGFNSRPIRIDLEDFVHVKLPIIVHWNFNHFVVLKEIKEDSYVIHDPAEGVVLLSKNEFSSKFTGIALELIPSTTFEKKEEKQKISIKALVGSVKGINTVLVKIVSIAVALELFVLIMPIYSQWVVDNVIPNNDQNLLLVLSLSFAMIFIIGELIKAVRSWFILHASIMIGLQWSTNLFRKLLSLPVDFFEKRSTGDVLSKFQSFKSIQETLSNVFLGAILDAVMAVGMLILMFIYSIQLTIIAVFSAIIYWFVRYAFMHPLKNATENLIVCSAKADGFFLETIRGIRSIKMNGMIDVRNSSWFNLIVDNYNAECNTKKLTIAYELLSGIIFGTLTIFVMYVGAQQVMNQLLSLGMLMAFVIYSSQFTMRISSLIEMIISVKLLRVHCERLADIALNESEGINDFEKNDFEISDLSIEVDKLNFRYSRKDEYILSNISFKVAEGESVAIVGPSGCGKSTLLKILTGILSPSDGRIIFGGIDLKRIKLKYLRTVVAVVMQDDQLLSGSIKDNITMFSANFDDNLMVEVCELAGIHNQIELMPMKYHTLIGDMGTTLSGGQKQRILLARALYQRPKFLLLDEATSNLDVESEFHVNESIKSLKITRLIIAHRPETIRSADRVIDLSLINQSYK